MTVRHYDLFFVFGLYTCRGYIYIEDLEPETWTAPKHSAFMSYEMNLTVSKIELHLVTDVAALQDFLGKEMQT